MRSKVIQRLACMTQMRWLLSATLLPKDENDLYVPMVLLGLVEPTPARKEEFKGMKVSRVFG